MNMHDWSGMSMGWMWLFWLLIVIAVVAIVVFVINLARHSSSTRRPSAEEILKERFARGEITKDQYEEQLKTLRGG